MYALGHACTHRRISDVRRYQHSVEGVSDHLSYNAYYAANPGQTNQHTQGIVRAESGYYCRDPLRFSLWDSIGSTLILNNRRQALGLVFVTVVITWDMERPYRKIRSARIRTQKSPPDYPQIGVVRRRFGDPNLPNDLGWVRTQPNKLSLTLGEKIGYTSRFVRVILAQGPC